MTTGKFTYWENINSQDKFCWIMLCKYIKTFYSLIKFAMFVNPSLIAKNIIQWKFNIKRKPIIMSNYKLFIFPSGQEV